MLPRPFRLRATFPPPRPSLHLRPPPHITRTLIAAPTSGPLLTRRADRALPPLPSSRRVWLRTLPFFVTIVTLSALGIFNYQKASSSVVHSSLYALRTSKRGRELLGDEIYFRDKVPWIWGSINQVKGRVDVRFGVKGTEGRGVMRFRSERVGGRMGKFETMEWSLEMEDGTVVQLLEDKNGDPFQGVEVIGDRLGA